MCRSPVVIAHRGASAERPEHTLAAYRRAIVEGADFIEPDLVLTRDGHLIARHDNELSSTTNVAEVSAFADRRTRKCVDGVERTGWFSEDFTLEEIRCLQARERVPQVRPGNTAFDRERIPTLEEIIALVREMESTGHHAVGIYPETKHPTWFAREGRHLEGTAIEQSISERLVAVLTSERFTDSSRLFIQSFEVENLIELAERILPAAGLSVPLIQLYGDLDARFAIGQSSFSRPWDVVFNVRHGRDLAACYGGLTDCVQGGIHRQTHYGDLASPAALEHIAAHYASGIGPWKDSLLPRVRSEAHRVAPDVMTGAVHPLLMRARAAGLEVHAYTLRPEAVYLSRGPDGEMLSMEDEVVQLLELGVTGFFTDAPALGLSARTRFRAATRQSSPSD